MKKQIVKRIADEFKNGNHQRDIKDLPFEIQYRLECSWGEAMNEANKIRVKGGE
jgi:hypothetical protein